MASKERPQRVIDAPFLKFNVLDALERIQSEAQWRSEDRNAITLTKTNEMCVILIALHQGARMSRYFLGGPFSLFVLKGKICFVAEGERTELESNGLACLNREIPHEIEALEDSSFLLTLFYPSAPQARTVAT
jgi:quercetin dioxygenase-like cupin family protein